MNPTNPATSERPNSRQDARMSEDAKSDATTPSRPKSFNPGRFDNNRERAREAGRKGGENPNNSGRFDNNPQRAREAGQKGGQSSQAARSNNNANNSGSNSVQ